MTIPVSKVDAVKDYLFNQISALAILTQQPSGIQPTQVQYDLIGVHRPEEYIEVGDEIQQEARPESLVGGGGTNFLFERFRIKVTIVVRRQGDDAIGTTSDAWKRANALSQAIDTLVRSDLTAGGLVQLSYPAAYRSTSGWDKGGKGRVVEIVKEIEFRTLN